MLYRPGVLCHWSAVRFLVLPVCVLVGLPVFAAETEDKPVGRSIAERFGSPTKQQELVFDTRQGAVGNGRSFTAGAAHTKDFQFSQRFAPAKYETTEYATKKSWFGNFRFGSKPADLRTKSDIPNADTAAALKSAPTKSAATKDAREGTKTMAVRDLPDGDRDYLGPERQKLNNAVDPKTLADWRKSGEVVVDAGTYVERVTGLKQLSVDDVREILNKNK